MSKQQRKAVRHKKGHLTLHAGPGCGKTHVLILMIIEAISRGVQPNTILVITYSKKTVADFKHRLKTVIGKDAELVNVCTFHSFGLQLICDNFKLFGFTSKPSVVSSANAIYSLVDEVASNNKVKQPELKKAVSQYLKGANTNSLGDAVQIALKELIEIHQENKRQTNTVDFDDMQTLPLEKLKHISSLLRKTAAKYQLLLVDELQDINRKQSILIATLAVPIGTSVTVGDNKQNIYGFQGSHYKYMHELEKALRPKIHYLTETFRCPKESLDFINAIGKEITGNKHVDLISNVSGHTPVFMVCKNVDVQADFIALQIQQYKEEGTPYSDFAFLGRTNKELERLNLALTSRDIPCVKNFVSDEEIATAYRLIRDFLRIARWKHRTDNDEDRSIPKKAIKNVLKTVGVKPKELKKIVDAVTDNGWSMFKVKSEHSKYKRINDIKNAITKASECESLDEAISRLMDCARPLFNKSNSKHKDELLSELSSIKLMVRSKTWININLKKLYPAKREDDVVELTTCHSAKGKEWPYVFVTHVVDGSIPSFYFSKKTDEGFAEELRVFYVAITRHSKKLWILQTQISNDNYSKKSKNKDTNFKNESRFLKPTKQHLDISN